MFRGAACTLRMMFKLRNCLYFIYKLFVTLEVGRKSLCACKIIAASSCANLICFTYSVGVLKS